MQVLSRSLLYGHLSLFIPRFNCFVLRYPEFSCTPCTLRFLFSVRLALESLMTIKRGAIKLSNLFGGESRLYGSETRLLFFLHFVPTFAAATAEWRNVQAVTASPAARRCFATVCLAVLSIRESSGCGVPEKTRYALQYVLRNNRKHTFRLCRSVLRQGLPQASGAPRFGHHLQVSGHETVFFRRLASRQSR